MNAVGHSTKDRRYWYFIYRRQCVLCGKCDENRERRYTPKPENSLERLEDRQDACHDHFL